ncbi:MAG TPA: hypothetical protein VGX23_13485 [Actinocrinis sp.]|nr:hypothetical protein [Actinocrinis sp.]
MHLRQRLVTGSVAGGALLAQLSLSPVAVAAGAPAPAASASINGSYVSTNVSMNYSGKINSGGGFKDPPQYARSPTCWLSPFGGDGASPVATYTPSEFGAYIDNLITLGTGGGSLPAQSSDAYNFQTEYKTGSPATNGVVHLSSPPYNTGVSGGSWDWEVCSNNADWVTILNLQKALNATNDTESWFWVTNGPAGAGVLSPAVLAEYAAANLQPAPLWPVTQPSLGVAANKQTVNLSATVTLPQNAQTLQGLGYVKDSATATLILNPNITSTVTAVPTSITITSADIAGGSPVTCNFTSTPVGFTLGQSCSLPFTKASPPGGVAVTGSELWSVNWNGAPAGSNWPRTIKINLPTQNVNVQEIQTIVNPATN